jgi:hypothetical protein
MEIVKFLIDELKMDIDIISNSWATPLHLACEKGHQEVVLYLLNAGASTSIRDAQLYNCLELAIMMRNAQLIKDTEAFDTPMRKLIRYMPDMALWLIENKLTKIVGGPGQKVYQTIYDYEFYEDMLKVRSWYYQSTFCFN